MNKYKFKAKIQAGDGGGAYVIFPYDVEKEFGTKGRVPVKATFDGVPDTVSLMKYGTPGALRGPAQMDSRKNLKAARRYHRSRVVEG